MTGTHAPEQRFKKKKPSGSRLGRLRADGSKTVVANKTSYEPCEGDDDTNCIGSDAGTEYDDAVEQHAARLSRALTDVGYSVVKTAEGYRVGPSGTMPQTEFVEKARNLLVGNAHEWTTVDIASLANKYADYVAKNYRFYSWAPNKLVSNDAPPPEKNERDEVVAAYGEAAEASAAFVTPMAIGMGVIITSMVGAASVSHLMAGNLFDALLGGANFTMRGIGQLSGLGGMFNLNYYSREPGGARSRAFKATVADPAAVRAFFRAGGGDAPWVIQEAIVDMICNVPAAGRYQ